MKSFRETKSDKEILTIIWILNDSSTKIGKNNKKSRKTNNNFLGRRSRGIWIDQIAHGILNNKANERNSFRSRIFRSTKISCMSMTDNKRDASTISRSEKRAQNAFVLQVADILME